MFSLDVRLSMLSCGRVLDWSGAGGMVGCWGGVVVVGWLGGMVLC